ncbi:DNA replication regulator SLD3-domain-containing protein [Hypoxylon sp. NC1633]|nr:DNA replication regulator SLD3-domain-containing protein [Hypoxylon sp. NC1633]
MAFGALDSDASRPPSSSILLPLTDARLNLKTGSTPDNSQGRKRKRDAEALQDLLKASFVIKPHPTKLTIKPRSLQPLMLLPREHLQLSFLDLSLPYGSFESSRYYESSIKILDLEGRVGSRPVVLIARLETDKTVYVLERQKNGLYTLCHFGSWVDLQELERCAIASCHHLIEKRQDSSIDSNIPRPLITPQLHHETKKRRLAIEAIQSLVKKPGRSRSVSTLSQLVSPIGPPTPGPDNSDFQPSNAHISATPLPSEVPKSQAENQVTKAPEAEESLIAPTAESIFENIRNQYLESLYHSMGSLAYFAKGPLSRARATFHLDCDSNLEMSDLIDFLKSLVKTTGQIDKKYRKTIPDIISKMKRMFQDSDAEQSAAKKKRKTNKIRLGRDGLYPMEEDHVRKWWTVRKPRSKDDEVMTTAAPHEAKLQIAWLRSRETQLQMIIILEILALEPLVAQDSKDSQLPGLSALEEAVTETPKDVAPKKRNRHSLSSFIDVHADRLCIWQSTLDEVKLPDDSHVGNDPETQRSSRMTSDPLKDFCVDIVMPFFSARLPDKCDSINRKLGGPVMLPPPKPRMKRPEKPEFTPKPKQKPGSVTKRTAPSKSSKTLESVLSKETERNRRSMSRGPSGVIALMRSVSTSMLKRENSEPLSMVSIPRADSVTSQERPSRPLSSASTNRKSGEEKAKKEALVKAELQDAITALRRPNRDVVSKAIAAEAAERRATTSLSQSRKSRKPSQLPRPQDIVKATPVGNRFRDVFGMGVGNQPTRPRGTDFIERGSIPSSSTMPSSAPRKRSHGAAFPLEESPAIPRSRASSNRIEATPVRPQNPKQSFMFVPEADEEDILASSPIMSRKPSRQSFRDSGIDMPTSPVNEFAETPLKRRAAPILSKESVKATPAKRNMSDDHISATATAGKDAAQGEQEPEKRPSIFERLGWDDDDLDELG